MTILTGIGLKTRKAKYKGRRCGWVGRCWDVELLADYSSCASLKKVDASPRQIGHVRLVWKRELGQFGMLDFRRTILLFGLSLFFLSRLNAPSPVSSNICSLEFSSLFTSISMVGGSSWPFSFQVSCDFSLTVERRWISTLPSDEEN